MPYPIFIAFVILGSVISFHVGRSIGRREGRALTVKLIAMSLDPVERAALLANIRRLRNLAHTGQIPLDRLDL